MLRKSKTKMGSSRLLGLMYIIGQILGGIITGLCVKLLHEDVELTQFDHPTPSSMKPQKR